MDEKVKKKKGSKIDESNSGSGFELELNKGKKRKHKEGKKKHGTDEIVDLSEAQEKNCTGEVTERQTDSIDGNRETENHINKKKKKKKRKECDALLDGMQEVDASKPSKKGKMTEDNEFQNNEHDLPLVKDNEAEGDDQGKKKKKSSGKSKLTDKSKINECDQDLAKSSLTEDDEQGKKRKAKKKTKASTTESPSPAPGSTSKPKRVTFSDKVEVCSDDIVVRGIRFTPEEDEKIKEAVFSYIKSHDLGDEGLDMVLHCRLHPEVKDCWKEIAATLPHRPHGSVYNRAHVLFERDEKRNWTEEEVEFIKNVQKQHGSDWKSIAEALGKSRFHVKDTWRRIKLDTAKTGHWTQEEYQNLFDLVNLDLRVRALEESKQSRHGMLRDNISWEAIAGKLETRTSQRCCKKWYEQITSPMVADNMWSDTDDYRLINALFTLDACCFEEVEWDYLLDHRPGDVCRKRWNEMVRHIGELVGKSFVDQVEILAKRFCPELLEAREAFDSKPVIN
ncbi:PREDICTED: cyclin-D-binding Myb-like transcription factor 1 isoform X2 [Lupinus angustifolius]|uniref:cyclin-D-binding Myb-like transcription factor 1 isoform X2 n=1 Tax=Lupinus angustifolius TaxID=3871 RepID=UPI00092F18E5|nr:PREDICTED: cyclin-D-binding Myb-like transcription factor 1 isoform X2 [Lupinus angustifolius]